MTIEASAITRELTDYLREHPDELSQLLPLYDALRDHAQRERCPHDGRCPEVTAGALLLNEHGHVLILRHGGGWAFGEATPEPGDNSLRQAAYSVLREFGGLQEAWALPSAESPVIIDVTPPHRKDTRPRLRVGFRYLFATHTSAIAPAVMNSGLARWVPLDKVNSRIAARLRPHIATVCL
ncbi:NUDIX hydrolase [Streptomyces sp. NPDC048644]|uniref:NUDIX hydrolase n=1 Tax=Streptomyces sp. NPDC048644 TaxID=3365582 RepID=UPI003717C72E